MNFLNSCWRPHWLRRPSIINQLCKCFSFRLRKMLNQNWCERLAKSSSPEPLHLTIEAYHHSRRQDIAWAESKKIDNVKRSVGRILMAQHLNGTLYAIWHQLTSRRNIHNLPFRHWQRQQIALSSQGKCRYRIDLPPSWRRSQKNDFLRFLRRSLCLQKRRQ